MGTLARSASKEILNLQLLGGEMKPLRFGVFGCQKGSCTLSSDTPCTWSQRIMCPCRPLWVQLVLLLHHNGQLVSGYNSRWLRSKEISNGTLGGAFLTLSPGVLPNHELSLMAKHV